MEPIIVYRIEHPNSGKGPFTHPGRSFGEHYQHLASMPEPEDDPGITHFGYHHFCAFHSLESFVNLVYPRHWRKFREEGFTMCVYEVRDYIMGKDQVVFTKRTATLLRTITEYKEIMAELFEAEAA